MPHSGETNRINDVKPIAGKSRFYDALMRAVTKYPREEQPSAPCMLDLFWAVQDEFDHMMSEAQDTLNVETYMSDDVLGVDGIEGYDPEDKL